jgi:hypothetical protein
MFSMNKLVSDLEQNQEKVSNDILDNITIYKENEEKSIYEDYIINSETTMKKLSSSIYSKYCHINDFYYKHIMWKQNTFMYSLLVLLDNNFDFMLNKRKAELIDAIRKKMCYDLVEKNYYSKFGYTRKKKFKREKLQKYLMDLKINTDSEKYLSVKKYIVDYFNINVFIISEEKVESIYTERDNNGLFKYRPTILLYTADNIYYPIIKNIICNEKLYLDYDINKDIIDELLTYVETPVTYYEHTTMQEEFCMNDTEDNKDLSEDINLNINIECKKKDINYGKMKITEIQELCKESEIDIYKTSEKTGKKIKKTKLELINEIKNKPIL